MSGFCMDCGSNPCLCDQIAGDIERYGTADAVEYLRNQIAERELEIEGLKDELRWSKQREWRPADGIWRVIDKPGSRSYTKVADPDVPEQEAIVRAVLETHADVVVKAIMGAYDRSTFCRTMLEHVEHEGKYCGVFPSRYAIWEAVRDALAQTIAAPAVDLSCRICSDQEPHGHNGEEIARSLEKNHD